MRKVAEPRHAIADQSSVSPRSVLPLLAVISFALGLNDAFLNPILPDIARDLNVSIAVAGQLATITLVIGAVSTLLLGVLSDLYGRRAFLLGGLIVVGAANLGLGLAPSFALALVSRFVDGFGLVFPVSLALVGDRYVGLARDQAMARILSANALAWVLGVPGVALVAGFVGWRQGVAGLGALLLLTAVVGLVALPDHLSPAATRGAARALRDIWESHRGRTDLWLAFLTAGIRGAYWTAFLTYAGGWLHDTFQLPTWQLGPVFTASALAYMAGIEVGTRWAKRTGRHSVIAYANAGAGILLLLLPLVPVLAVDLLGFVVATLLCGAGSTALQTLTLQLAPASRGATMSLSNSLISIGGALGVVAAGLAIAALGYPGLGLVAGLLAAATVGLARWLAAKRPAYVRSGT
jgi:predicted MFS family arabinose efflux permease